MPNHYCESSTSIPVPAEKLEQAALLVQHFQHECENGDSSCIGVYAEIVSDGVRVYHDENFNPELAAEFIRGLVDKLRLEGTVICSWSYTCSKAVDDAFSGGAFAVARGCDVAWVDARAEAKAKLAEQRGGDC